MIPQAGRSGIGRVIPQTRRGGIGRNGTTPIGPKRYRLERSNDGRGEAALVP